VSKQEGVTPPQHVPHELRDRPFKGTDAVAKGLLTKQQLRSSCWRHLFADVYAWSGLPLDRVARAAAVSLAAPPSAVISGRWAAWLLGVDILRPGDDRVEVTIARDDHMWPRPAITIRHALIPGADLVVVEGIITTSVFRTAFDLVRRRKPNDRRDLIESVVALDALAHKFWINFDDFLAYSLSHRGWRGVRLVPDVILLADRGAESPMESRLRMLLVLSGLPSPHVQYEVPVDGTIYRIDLAYPEHRLAIEYDGRDHARRWTTDIRRQNLLEDRGWQFRRYVSDDYYRRPERILTQVRRGLRRS
jgi:very-short-patch-repair endonuclease